MDITCRICGNPISDVRRRRRAIYCSYECSRERQRRDYRKRNPIVTGLPSGVIGALSELRIAADLLQKGYEVFRSVSPACSCDLAVLKDGMLKRIEVRTAHYQGNGKLGITTARLHNSKFEVLALITQDGAEIKYIGDL